jgi:hypothetical protein
MRFAVVKVLTRAAHQMLQRVELVVGQRQRDPVERDVQASLGTAGYGPFPLRVGDGLWVIDH